MKAKLTATLLLLSISAGCAGTLQYASISEAYKSYDRGNYEKTLVLINQAQNARPMTANQQAEVAYLKAEALVALGELQAAESLYDYIEHEHAESQYAYLVRSARAAEG